MAQPSACLGCCCAPALLCTRHAPASCRTAELVDGCCMPAPCLEPDYSCWEQQKVQVVSDHAAAVPLHTDLGEGLALVEQVQQLGDDLQQQQPMLQPMSSSCKDPGNQPQSSAVLTHL